MAKLFDMAITEALKHDGHLEHGLSEALAFDKNPSDLEVEALKLRR